MKDTSTPSKSPRAKSQGAIDVAHLSFDYPGHPVLKDVSFKVSPGEFLGIIGPNGGGKTTLLHLLMGFLKPNHGEILLGGESPKKKRLEIGFVPQHFQYDRAFPITALEIVLMGRLSQAPRFGGYSKQDYKIAWEMIDTVGMKSHARAQFCELSAGQAQRILLARALSGNPHYLFLDEAVANIDPATQEEVYKLLKQLKNNITTLLVTHDMRAALSQVDRVLLVDGTVVPYSQEEVCEHFALGLYHPPINLTKGPS